LDAFGFGRRLKPRTAIGPENELTRFFVTAEASGRLTIGDKKEIVSNLAQAAWLSPDADVPLHSGNKLFPKSELRNNQNAAIVPSLKHPMLQNLDRIYHPRPDIRCGESHRAEYPGRRDICRALAASGPAAIKLILIGCR